jgi:hypothetical protein
MAVLLILLVVFVLTWFASLPPPFWIILVILEAIALVLFVQPYAVPLFRY